MCIRSLGGRERGANFMLGDFILYILEHIFGVFVGIVEIGITYHLPRVDLSSNIAKDSLPRLLAQDSKSFFSMAGS